MTDAGNDIRSLVREINAAWLGGDLQWLRRHFHSEIVMVSPAFTSRVEGVDACVQSFEDFLGTAEVTDFRESEVTGDARGTAGVGTFRFDIAYRMDGREYREAGREIWVFARADAGWKAIWRVQLPIDH